MRRVGRSGLVLNPKKWKARSRGLAEAVRPHQHHPQLVLPQPVTEVTTLGNGLRVCTEETLMACETVTVGVWIDAGSRYEAESNNGVAHFLEHMAFKGTSRRRQRVLEEMIENMGAKLNAYTSREQTVYYAKLFKEDVGVGLEVLSDILGNSLLEPGAIERERDVIMREMEEVNKQHEELILDLLHEAAYRGGGLGRTILGPKENIDTISRRDLKDYIETHYTAPRMLVVAAGGVDHAQVSELSEQYFGQYPTESRTDFAVDFDPAIFTPTEVRIATPPTEEPRAHVALAYEGAHWTSEYSMPLMVLQTMLGQWDRLNPAGGGADSPYSLVRALDKASDDPARRGLDDPDVCHSYVAMNTCYKDTGLFSVYLVCPPHGVEPTVRALQSYLASLTKEGTISEHDVQRAKAQLKANIISQLDALAHVCEDIGRQYLTYQRRLPLIELIARIDAVTPHHVTATARHFLQGKSHAMAAYGAVQHLQPYDDIHIQNFL